MIPTSADYKGSVFAPSRQVNARATVTMSAFSQLEPQTFLLTNDFVGKVTGSNVANPNIVEHSNGASLLSPSAFTSEIVQQSYTEVSSVDGTTFIASTLTNTSIKQVLFSFDIIQILERKFGRNIWQGKTLLADKITIAKALVTKHKCSATGRGSGVGGNSFKLARWSATSSVYDSWDISNVGHTSATNQTISVEYTNITSNIDANGFVHYIAWCPLASNGTTANTVYLDHVEMELTVSQTTTRTFYDDRIISASSLEEVAMLSITTPANQLSITMDNTDNLFNFLTLNNMQTIIASKPKVDLEFAVVLSDGVSEEWIPMGSYYVDSWKNNVGNMTITFVGHDWLYILGNTSKPIVGITNVRTDLVNFFSTIGLTDYYIDPVIDTYPMNGRKESTSNARDYIQNIGIATGCTVYQDRYGKFKIEKLPSITQASSYTTFTTTQGALGFNGFTSASTFSTQDTDGGMRAITLDQMYQTPEITLDRSVYQIIVNVYSTNPLVETVTPYTFTNTAISGNNGESFTLDIPLIQSQAMAQEVANRIFTETNFNAIYISDWRQNPCLIATDIVMINDTEISAKQTRVTKQEYKYQGYLTGTTESRGGL